MWEAKLVRKASKQDLTVTVGADEAAAAEVQVEYVELAVADKANPTETILALNAKIIDEEAAAAAAADMLPWVELFALFVLALNAAKAEAAPRQMESETKLLTDLTDCGAQVKRDPIQSVKAPYLERLAGPH